MAVAAAELGWPDALVDHPKYVLPVHLTSPKARFLLKLRHNLPSHARFPILFRKSIRL
jgi:hypothetical protein